MTRTVGGVIGALRADRQRASVLLPEDGGYDDARSLWNGELDRRPAVIARCRAPPTSPRRWRTPASRSWRSPCAAAATARPVPAACDGGLMIDLSAHERRRRSTRRPGGRSRGGGATWADLDAATQAHGLAVTGGFISHTGIGGLTLGGGMGWLTRQARPDRRQPGRRRGGDRRRRIAARLGGRAPRPVLGAPRRRRQLRRRDALRVPAPRGRADGPPRRCSSAWSRAARSLRLARDLVPTLPDRLRDVLIAGLNAPPAPFVPDRAPLPAPAGPSCVVGFGSAEEHAGSSTPCVRRCRRCSSSSPRCPTPRCSRCSTTAHGGAPAL